MRSMDIDLANILAGGDPTSVQPMEVKLMGLKAWQMWEGPVHESYLPLMYISAVVVVSSHEETDGF